MGEHLLNIDPSKFISKPDIRRTNDHARHRIFEDYTTGTHYETLYHEVKKALPHAIPLCIGVSIDETHILSGRKNFTPVYITILNCIDDAFKWNLLGYVPDKLPYSSAAVKEVLETTKGLTENIIKYSLRQQKLY